MTQSFYYERVMCFAANRVAINYQILECSIKRYIFAKIKALKIFVPELTCC